MRAVPIAALLLFTLIASPAAAQTGGWFGRVDATQAEQPRWITPLATTTPRLEEEVRYDLAWQLKPDGMTTFDAGAGKGLEVIPSERVEIIVGVPAYFERDDPRVADGFGDESFLLKYRLASANESHGDYIVTAFLGLTLPTGSGANGAPHAVVTPTLAYGKGLGAFDVQGTFGVSMPTGDTAALGRVYAFNDALQYRGVPKVWPELEINATVRQGGARSGERVVYLTPGLVVGKLRLRGRIGLTLGAGVQFAISDVRPSDHNIIVSMRMPF